MLLNNLQTSQGWRENRTFKDIESTISRKIPVERCNRFEHGTIEFVWHCFNSMKIFHYLCLCHIALSICASNAFTYNSARNHERQGSILRLSKNALEESVAASIQKKHLLSLIPKLNFGAPATNLTTDADVVAEIEKTVSVLEYLTPLPHLTESKRAVEVLNGEWQLVYSDASEITRITKLPLGFRLGPVFQPINVADGRFENQALIKHRFLIVSGHTRVVAKFELAPLGEVNRAGVKNVGDRANVKFEKVIFTLRRLLCVPTFGKIRKAATPNGPSEQKGVVPCIDVTYLDDTMRVSRGGDGSLFILVRPTSRKPMPMLPLQAADKITIDEKSPTYDASVDILPPKQ